MPLKILRSSGTLHWTSCLQTRTQQHPTFPGSIFFLAIFPQVYEKLLKEVTTEFGLSTSPADIVLQRLKSVKYLQWVLNESACVRLGVQINTRKCIHNTILPTGGSKDGSQAVTMMEGDQMVLHW